jgi:hypothetical protein
MDLRTAADSESLAKLYQPAALLDPPSGDVVGKVSFVQQADGTVQLVATRSLPILSLDLVVLAEDSIPSPTEFYLVLAMQLPVWFQEKLWLRQVRDRARSDIIGREFIQHATTPLTGIGSPLPKQFDLGSDPPAELSRSEAMSVSAETLVRRLLIDSLGIIPDGIDSLEWRKYLARITIFYKPQVALPSLGPDGSIAFGSVPLYSKDAAFPVLSVHLDDENAWTNGIKLPDDISLFEMSITWFAKADMAPFFAVERRRFRIV